MQHQLKGEWNSASLGGARFPPRPCGWCSLPPLGGAAVPPWVALPSPLLLGDGVVFPHGQFETVASRQCRQGKPSHKTSARRSHWGITHTLCHSSPPSLPPFLRLPLSLLSHPLSFPLYLDCDGDVQSCDNSPTHKIHRVWCQKTCTVKRIATQNCRHPRQSHFPMAVVLGFSISLSKTVRASAFTFAVFHTSIDDFHELIWVCHMLPFCSIFLDFAVFLSSVLATFRSVHSFPPLPLPTCHGFSCLSCSRDKHSLSNPGVS